MGFFKGLLTKCNGKGVLRGLKGFLVFSKGLGELG